MYELFQLFFETISNVLGPKLLEAISSSVYRDDSMLWGPRFGWTGVSTSKSGFFTSKAEFNPWIQFQIKQTSIEGIVVINRKDNGGERFRDIKVRAGLQSEGFNNPVVGSYRGPGVTGESHYIEFEQTTDTKYITILKVIIHISIP